MEPVAQASTLRPIDQVARSIIQAQTSVPRSLPKGTLKAIFDHEIGWILLVAVLFSGMISVWFIGQLVVNLEAMLASRYFFHLLLAPLLFTFCIPWFGFGLFRWWRALRFGQLATSDVLWMTYQQGKNGGGYVKATVKVKNTAQPFTGSFREEFRADDTWLHHLNEGDSVLVLVDPRLLKVFACIGPAPLATTAPADTPTAEPSSVAQRMP
jgi:hypothetical protein